MKTYMVQSSKYSSEFIFAEDEEAALEKYALLQGCENSKELVEECVIYDKNNNCFSNIDDDDCIEITCLSSAN